MTLIKEKKYIKKTKKGIFINFFAPAVIGIIIAGGVSLLDYLVRDFFLFYLFHLNSYVLYLILPVFAILLSSAITRYLIPSKENRLTEDYIIVYHSKEKTLKFSNLPLKMIATIVTIIGGGCVGLEGPSIYLGANIGETSQKRWRENFQHIDPHTLMIAGAAAGFAALFKAPLTSIMFVLEVPYKNRLSSRALIPSLISCSFSYLTAAFLTGPEPLFNIKNQVHFDVKALFVAPIIGVLCGIMAKMFIKTKKWTEQLKNLFSNYFFIYSLLCGLAVGSLGLITTSVFSKPFNYGPGYNTIRFLIENNVSFFPLLILFVTRFLSTPLTFSGGGTGGIFFPLVVLGVVVGSAFNLFLTPVDISFYPLIGLSSFVAAGYRTPLAAVTFAAETTGNPYVLIPSMIAAVFAFVTVGSKGVSDEQRD